MCKHWLEQALGGMNMSREVPGQQLIPRNLVDHELTPTLTQITGKAEDRCAQGCEPCPAPPSYPHGAPASTSSWNFLYHESGPSLLPPPLPL